MLIKVDFVALDVADLDDMLVWIAFDLVDLKCDLSVLIFSELEGIWSEKLVAEVIVLVGLKKGLLLHSVVQLEVLLVQLRLTDLTVRDELLAQLSIELFSAHLHWDELFVWLLRFGIFWVKSLQSQLLLILIFTVLLTHLVVELQVDFFGTVATVVVLGSFSDLCDWSNLNCLHISLCT